MGSIINPRGTSGSGKTELVRRLIADYGWSRGEYSERLRRPGCDRPIGYQLQHPFGGAPLIVLGDYEKASGGCDTIRATDGGLDEIYRLADHWASAGHDVLLEGSAWSTEYMRSAALARRHRYYVLLLSTTVEQSARNLVVRRRLGRAAYPSLRKALLAQRRSVQAACSSLATVAAVKHLDLGGPLIRARELLGLRQDWRSPAAVATLIL